MNKYRAKVGYKFILPFLIGLICFQLGPLLISLVMSFFNWPVMGDKEFIGLGNYISMFHDPQFYKSLIITFKYSIIFVPLNLIIALSLALLLNYQKRGGSFFRVAFYLPSMISAVPISIIIVELLNKNYGFINYLLSFIGLGPYDWIGNPTLALIAIVAAALMFQGTMMMIFYTALKNVPEELYESAKIDGSSSFRSFLSITLPMISPTLLFNLVTTIIASFQSLALVKLITAGGPAMKTYVYSMFVYDNAFFYHKYGYSSANAWFMFLIVIGLTAIVFISSKKWTHYVN